MIQVMNLACTVGVQFANLNHSAAILFYCHSNPRNQTEVGISAIIMYMYRYMYINLTYVHESDEGVCMSVIKVETGIPGLNTNTTLR